MKVSQLLHNSRKTLIEAKSKSAHLDAVILISFVFNLTKEQVLLGEDFEISSEKLNYFYHLLNRRSKCEPISHLIGKREFFGEEFLVTADVLDPRCDSETLIEAVLKRFCQINENKKVLELGVGSGCLLISLLMQRKNWFGLGIDISPKAIEICLKNAIKHQINNRIILQNADLFSGLEDNQKFDILISNPPYIPSLEIEALQPEVANYEPRIALDGGIDGLDFYRRIADSAAKFLQKNSVIFLEIGLGQEGLIAKIFADFSFDLVKSYRDLGGIIRVLEFQSTNQT